VADDVAIMRGFAAKIALQCHSIPIQK
jgi:hypothetical protein